MDNNIDAVKFEPITGLVENLDSATIRKSVESVSIKTPEEFGQVSKEFALAHHPFNNLVPREQKFYDENGRRLDEFMFRSVVDYLYGDIAPNNALEIASAGSVALATALPGTQIVSLDLDKSAFPRCSLRELPGMNPKDIEKLSGREKVELTQKLLKNWTPEVADVKDIPHKDNEFDLTITINNPNLFPSGMREMARITKSGGYVVSINHELFKELSTSSFYDTGKFNSPSFKDFSGVSNSFANEYGLEQIRVPEGLKKLENSVEWNTGDGNYSSGFVIQIFKKK